MRSLGSTFRLSSLFARFVGSHLLGFVLEADLALSKRGFPNPTMPPAAPLLVELEKPPEEPDGPRLYDELGTGSEELVLPKP